MKRTMLEFLLKMRVIQLTYVNQLQQPVADQLRNYSSSISPSIMHVFQDQTVYSFCMAALFGCRWLLHAASKTSGRLKSARAIIRHTICRPSKTTRKKGGCRRSARGCRCNSLTTSHRSCDKQFADLRQGSGNHPKNSGC